MAEQPPKQRNTGGILLFFGSVLLLIAAFCAVVFGLYAGFLSESQPLPMALGISGCGVVLGFLAIRGMISGDRKARAAVYANQH